MKDDSDPDQVRRLDGGIYDGPEREVLRRALEKSGLSARAASLQMDISDTRLRHIINGYQPVGRGQRIAVIAPADTLARIATALGVKPDELDAVGRADAATEMRDRAHQREEWGDDTLAVIENITAWADDPVNNMAPDDALRFFDDAVLLAEVERRLARLRAQLRDAGIQPAADHTVTDDLVHPSRSFLKEAPRLDAHFSKDELTEDGLHLDTAASDPRDE